MIFKALACAAWYTITFLLRQWKPLCAASAFSVVAVAADAGPRLVYETGGESLFSIAIADHWMVNVGKETPASEMPDGTEPNPRVISLVPDRPEASLWVGFWSPLGVGSLDDATKYLIGLEGRLLENAKVESRSMLDVAGASGFILRGTGDRYGLQLEFSIAVLDLKGDRVAVFAFIGEPGEREQLQVALSSMLNSVQQIGEGADDVDIN